MSIDFAITCGNREEFLKQTLPVNLAKIASHKNMKLLVLNYNSNGDIDDYMKQYEDNEQVQYFRFIDRTRQFFHISHAKNIAARLCKSDYIINLDADNFLTAEYIDFVLKAIEGGYDLICNDIIPRSFGLGGRIGCRRWIFDHVRGYDEAMIGWGIEDTDFKDRCKVLGFQAMYVPYSDPQFSIIAHTDDIRVANMEHKSIHTSNTLNARLRGNNYRMVNADGYGCGTVTDLSGKEIVLNNKESNRFKIRKLVSEFDYASIFSPYSGGVVQFVDFPGNVGDGMIQQAQRQLAAFFNIREAQQDEIPTVIMYCGGGNIGLYNCKEYQAKAVELAKKYGVPLISLPQTWGEQGSFDGADKIFVRDRMSLEIAKGSILAPDLALCLDIHPSMNRPPIFNEGWFFREDSEKTMIPTLQVCDPAYWAANWQQYVLLASQYKVIRTNRLHFAIAGMLLGRDVILYDNVYYKNRSVYETWLSKMGCRFGF